MSEENIFEGSIDKEIGICAEMLHPGVRSLIQIWEEADLFNRKVYSGVRFTAFDNIYSNVIKDDQLKRSDMRMVLEKTRELIDVALSKNKVS
jgi:hypothetical protein